MFQGFSLARDWQVFQTYVDFIRFFKNLSDVVKYLSLLLYVVCYRNGLGSSVPVLASK